MWKLLFLAARGWRYIPKRQRRALMFAAATTARRHGPTIARAAGRAYKGARKLP
jgi:hypothetical protein